MKKIFIEKAKFFTANFVTIQALERHCKSIYGVSIKCLVNSIKLRRVMTLLKNDHQMICELKADFFRMNSFIKELCEEIF